jgi:hypothetical protein
MEQIEITTEQIIKGLGMKSRILRAEKDEENSCMVIETEQGQDWISCAECRFGEIECSYLKSRWGINPCLYRRGVRLGRGLEPDPRDVVKIIQNNMAVYNNMLEREGPFLKAEREMLGRFLQTETQELERVKGMLYTRGKV